MKIADFFRNPIRTHCEIQGVDTEVMVTVDYQPAVTAGPVCNLCSKPCDVLDQDQPVYTDAGFNLGPRTIYVSRCCRVGYSVNPAGALTEQAEVLDVLNLRGVSVMDSMFMVELEALEDDLLAMAHSAHASRVEDAREFARECRDEALAMGQSQRGVRL